MHNNQAIWLLRRQVFCITAKLSYLYADSCILPVYGSM